MLQRFLDRFRHWLIYRPERRYMRGQSTAAPARSSR